MKGIIAEDSEYGFEACKFLLGVNSGTQEN
jgi:hypothetical protein